MKGFKLFLIAAMAGCMVFAFTACMPAVNGRLPKTASRAAPISSRRNLLPGKRKRSRKLPA